MCMAETLRCSPEMIATLLMACPPIQNKSSINKEKVGPNAGGKWGETPDHKVGVGGGDSPGVTGGSAVATLQRTSAAT